MLAEEPVEAWGEVSREPQIQIARTIRPGFVGSRVVGVVHVSSSPLFPFSKAFDDLREFRRVQGRILDFVRR